MGAFSKKTYEIAHKEKPILSKEVSPINKEVTLFNKGMNSDRKLLFEANSKAVTIKKEESK